jgi:hypothetical protein
MNDLPKPDISPDFTIEDIHKIRAWNYERYKGMTSQEICEDTQKRANFFLESLKKPVDPAIVEEVKRNLESVRKERLAKSSKAS